MAIRFDELEWQGSASSTSNHFWLWVNGDGWCKAFVSKSISDPEAYSIMYWGKDVISLRAIWVGWQWLREKSPRDTELMPDIRQFDMFELALLLSTAEWEPPQE